MVEHECSPREIDPCKNHCTSNSETCKPGPDTLLSTNVHTNSLLLTCSPGMVTNKGPGDAEEMGTSTVTDETPEEKCTCYTDLPTK